MPAGFKFQRVGNVGRNVFVFQHPFQDSFALVRLQGFERGDKNFGGGFGGTHGQTIATNNARFKRVLTSASTAGKNHVADAFLAEEHHAQAVDADAARQGHAVFE